MKFVPTDPPRTFRVGARDAVILTETARIHLAADEVVTFITPSGKSHDVVAKSWGFYACGSMNGRLTENGFRSALVRNSATGRLFLLLVERECHDDFEAYLRSEGSVVERWLDEG